MEDNTETGIKETGRENVDWIHVPRDRDLVYPVMNLRDP
jgi:hypothetical protein